MKYYYSYFYEVENKDRYKTANDKYTLARTKDNAFLFTQGEIDRAQYRAKTNPEDVLDGFTNPKNVGSTALGFVAGLVVGLVLAGFALFIF